MEYLIVVLSFYDRRSTLLSTVEHYNSFACVERTRVVWHNPRTRPMRYIDAFAPSTDSLNNRFDPRAVGNATVALHIDDDVKLSEELVCSTFKEWKKHRNRIFAFNPRYVDFRKHRYEWNAVCARKGGAYNTAFVTKGAIFATKFLEWYFRPRWEEARRAVTTYVTGEDLLMSAALARLKIVAVSAKGHWVDIKHDGTNLGVRTGKKRNRVLDIINKAMTHYPKPRRKWYVNVPNLTATYNVGSNCVVY